MSSPPSLSPSPSLSLSLFLAPCLPFVIPCLEDTLKEWGFLQVMTQVIGQESYQATLHPLPVGSRIMGGQGKTIVSHKRSYPLMLRHHEWGQFPINY
jgi:hypothetical protein